MAATARSSGAQIAADEFGGTIDGAKIVILSADHQNKPDIGAAIASRWFEVEHVDAVADLVNSAVAFAVLNLAKKDNKLLLLTGAGSADFTGKTCAPDNLAQWVYDTYAAGSAAGEAMPYLGKTWFFITADYVFGKGVAGRHHPRRRGAWRQGRGLGAASRSARRISRPISCRRRRRARK